MLILLPPSEGKTAAVAGAPVDLDALWLPPLGPARRRVMTRLVALSRRTGRDGGRAALQALGLGPGQVPELARNAALAQAPAAAAATVYSGVLYQAMGPGELSAAGRGWLAERAVVFSGLWGVVRLTDRIPAYRCPIGARLPVLGALGAFWRRALAPHLQRVVDAEVVLDLRSAAYAATWTPRQTGRTATVRVLHERVVDGVVRRSVVSHHNKAAKGRLVRALADAAVCPTSVDDLVAALRDLGHTVEEQPAAGDRPRRLDLITTGSP